LLYGTRKEWRGRGKETAPLCFYRGERVEGRERRDRYIPNAVFPEALS
jgi:hypothetical protein